MSDTLKHNLSCVYIYQVYIQVHAIGCNLQACSLTVLFAIVISEIAEAALEGKLWKRSVARAMFP